MRNRKGQGGSGGQLLMEVGAVILAIVLFVVSASVMFMYKSNAVSTSIAATCYSSFEMTARAEGAIDDANADLKSDYGGWDVAKSTGIGAAVGSVFGPVGTGIGAALGFAKGMITRDMTKKYNKMVDKFGQAMKDSIPKMCQITSEDDCIGKADEVAQCLYKKAAATFYALGARKSRAKLDFNLFKTNVKVLGPGTILLKGSCNTYFEMPPYIPPEAEYYYDHCSKWHPKDIRVDGTNMKEFPACAIEGEIDGLDGKFCNITFYTVDEMTMTLTMLSLCQADPNGPFGNKCKCFVNLPPGYSVNNGLPNSWVSSIVVSHANRNLSTKVLEGYDWPGQGNLQGSSFPNYAGCGGNPAPPSKDALGTKTALGTNNIWWVTTKHVGGRENPNNYPSENTTRGARETGGYFLYFRLNADGTGVVITDAAHD